MKKILMLFLIILIFPIVSCNKETNLIKGITNYDYEIIEDKVTIIVPYNENSFLINNIKVNYNYSFKIYSDSNLETELNDELGLEVGINSYYLYIYNDDFNKTYNLIIERQEIKITNIEVIDFQEEYYLREKFKGGNLKITYNDKTTKIVPIDISMLSNFDTEEVGEHLISIKYADYYVVKKIMVSTDIKHLELKDRTNINEDNILELIAIYNIIKNNDYDINLDELFNYIKENKELYKELNQEELNKDNFKSLITAVESSGLTDSDVLNLSSILKELLVPYLEIKKAPNDILNILNNNKIEEIKLLLDELLDIINPNILASFYKYYLEASLSIDNSSLNNYLDQNNELSAFISNLLDKYDYDNLDNYVIELANFNYIILNTLVKLNVNDLSTLLKIYVKYSYNLDVLPSDIIDFSHSLANVIEYIYHNLDLNYLKEHLYLLILYFNNISYKELNTYLNTLKLLLNYPLSFIDFLDEVDSKFLLNISNIYDMLEGNIAIDYNIIIETINYFKSLIINVYDDPNFKIILGYIYDDFINKGNLANKDLFIDEVINIFNNIDFNNLKEEDLLKIENLIDLIKLNLNNKAKLSILNYNNEVIFFDKSQTIEERLNYLKSQYKLLYVDGSIVDVKLTLDNVVFSNNESDLNIGYFIYNDSLVYFNYLVYDKTNLNIINYDISVLDNYYLKSYNDNNIILTDGITDVSLNELLNKVNIDIIYKNYFNYIYDVNCNNAKLIVNEDTAYLYVKSIIDIYIPINLKNNMV